VLFDMRAASVFHNALLSLVNSINNQNDGFGAQDPELRVGRWLGASASLSGMTDLQIRKILLVFRPDVPAGDEG
jgi:hypothetical protein